MRLPGTGATLVPAPPGTCATAARAPRSGTTAQHVRHLLESRLRRAILLLGRVERVRADDVALVETHQQVPRLGLTEDLVLVVAVGPGLVAVLDADSPR